MKPVFVLCVGAQKAGTSWLHQMLNQQAYANLGFMKEYHIWDAKFSRLSAVYKARQAKPDNAGAALRRMMQNDSEVYGSYFKGLMNGEIHLTGDFTPSYSLLDAQNFTHIRQTLEHFDFDVKVVFLMRDPIDRVWSAMRMQKRNLERRGEPSFEADYIKNFMFNAKRPQNFERGRYEETIAELEKSFAADHIHYEIYEQLFSDKAMKNIESFLGVKLDNISLNDKVNSSPHIPLPEETQAEARDLFKLTYDFCNRKFPETKDLWN